MTGSLWPSWRPTRPSWRSSRGRKAQPRLMPDPTNARRGTHRPRPAGPVPRAWSTRLGWAGLGLLQVGPWRKRRKGEPQDWGLQQGLSLLAALAFPWSPPLCRDVGTVSQAGVSPSMSSLPSADHLLSYLIREERKRVPARGAATHACTGTNLVPPKFQPLLDSEKAPGPPCGVGKTGGVAGVCQV